MEGAVGTRGPGETQLETDKRLIKRRIQDLKLELEAIEARKQREVRTRGDLFTIGLVGYTNAGKSTLLNKLTNSEEFVADMLFATLDTRTRQWRLSDGRTVLLSDTVGFLQRLPHHLVASFHATLEEALHADLLLHVVDGSHPHADQQMAAVEEVLASLGKDLSDAIIVFNKTDALDDPLKLQYLRQGRPQEVVHISARTGAGLDALNAAVQRRLDRRSALVDLYFPLRSGRIEAAVRKLCAPIEDDYDAERSLRRLRVRLTEGALGNLMRSAGRELVVETIAAASEPRLA
jgi:GTP-binding protein HflX